MSRIVNAIANLIKKRNKAEYNITRYRNCEFLTNDGNKLEKKLQNQHYDEQNLDLLLSVLPKAGVFIDVGANIGIYTCIMGKFLEDSGFVHSFEPVRHIRSKALHNIKLNALRNVRMNDFALGASESTMQMWQVNPNQFRGGTSTFVKNENIDILGEEAFTKVNVQITTLDNYVLTQKLEKVDVIKIDIEGFELQFLTGATKTIQEFNPIILFEHDLNRLKVSGQTEQAFKKFFDEMDYSSFQIRRSGKSVRLLPYRFDGSMKGRDLISFPNSSN